VSDYDNKEHEVVPGVLRGYRQWQVQPDGLYACNFPVRWEAGVNTATHQGAKTYDYGDGRRRLHKVEVPDDQAAPVKGCSCGFYALHGTDLYRGHGPRYVSGSIKAYGHVILGTTGFRAQYVEIESLWIPDALEGRHTLALSVIRDHYPDVPVFDTWADLMQAFPPIPVTELIGPPEPYEDIFTRAWGPQVATISVEEFIRYMSSHMMQSSRQDPEQ